VAGPVSLSKSPTVVESLSARSAHRRRASLDRRRSRTGLRLVLPAFLVVAVFFLAPLGFAVYISLTNWPLVGSYHFVGLSNYTALVHDSVFLHALLFTVEYTAVITPCVFVFGYALAMLIRRRVTGIGFFRTVYFLPTVVGLTTISYMAVLELQPNSGIIDYVLSQLHIAASSTAWLASPGLAFIGISVLVVWSSSGLTMLILMAGMQAIPTELYEAAAVDGAGKWAREVRVTVPLLRRSIALSLIISVVGSFLAFNQFYIITGGGPGTSTATIVFWIYQVAFTQFHLGYATAMSIVLLAIVVIVSGVQFWLLRDNP
jgi:multiple sugar transport system permease protein